MLSLELDDWNDFLEVLKMPFGRSIYYRQDGEFWVFSFLYVGAGPPRVVSVRLSLKSDSESQLQSLLEQTKSLAPRAVKGRLRAA